MNPTFSVMCVGAVSSLPGDYYAVVCYHAICGLNSEQYVDLERYEEWRMGLSKYDLEDEVRENFSRFIPLRFTVCSQVST